MLLKICLILTIVAGLGTAYVGFFPVQDMIKTTRAARDDFHQKWNSETALYQKTDKELKKTKADLATTTSKLTETTAELDAANTKNTELDTANKDLTDKLGKMTSRAETAEQTLEQWRNLPPPAQIKVIIADLAATKKARDAVLAENKILVASRDNYRDLYNSLVEPDAAVPLPPGLIGKVMAVDPKYDFVVLNIGDDQGVKTRGEMMVNRKGRLIGKVRITSVQKDTSIASILPAWQRGQVMEGDQVLY
jgi:cell shape-determining protein MreC